jgi:lactoylglutathione lyase
MIRVGDLDAALEFFCKKLELVEILRVDNEKCRFSLTFLAAPDDVVMVHGSAWRMTALGR